MQMCWASSSAASTVTRRPEKEHWAGMDQSQVGYKKPHFLWDSEIPSNSCISTLVISCSNPKFPSGICRSTETAGTPDSWLAMSPGSNVVLGRPLIAGPARHCHDQTSICIICIHILYIYISTETLRKDLKETSISWSILPWKGSWETAQKMTCKLLTVKPQVGSRINVEPAHSAKHDLLDEAKASLGLKKIPLAATVHALHKLKAHKAQSWLTAVTWNWCQVYTKTLVLHRWVIARLDGSKRAPTSQPSCPRDVPLQLLAVSPSWSPLRRPRALEFASHRLRSFAADAPEKCSNKLILDRRHTKQGEQFIDKAWCLG